MAFDVALPSVALFFDTTGRFDVQEVVSGLQSGGRRVSVFMGIGDWRLSTDAPGRSEKRPGNGPPAANVAAGRGSTIRSIASSESSPGRHSSPSTTAS